MDRSAGGPDYRVSQKRRLAFAEVETRWRNYFRHGHHVNPAFDAVEYLILLSAETPTPKERRGLHHKLSISIANIFLGGSKRHLRLKPKDTETPFASPSSRVQCSSTGRQFAPTRIATWRRVPIATIAPTFVMEYLGRRRHSFRS